MNFFWLCIEDVDDFIRSMAMMILLTMMMVMMYIIPGTLSDHSFLSLSFIFHLLLSTSLLLLLPSFFLRCHPELFPRWRCRFISRMTMWPMAMNLCVNVDNDDDDGDDVQRRF